MSKEKKYLAECVKDGTFDFQKRKITKSDKAILKRIASALPEKTVDYVRRKIVGHKLKENGMTSIDGKEIDDDEFYLVYEKKNIKVNQLKKLIDSWKVYSSPVGVIFYGASMFPNEKTHNKWVEIINEYFGTDYPPLYPEDYFDEKDSDDKQEG